MSEPNPADRPFVAGMYDYYLGGTANSAADRAAVEEIRKVLPEASQAAWSNRGFLQRSVKKMVADYGVKQFLDIGAGLPTQRHTHDVVAEVTPDGRVVYVDVDPRVIERGAKILAGVEGAIAIQGDIREPDVILGHPETRRLIDFDEPVGVLMVAVTQFMPDDEDPWRTVGRYLDAVTPGSFLALSAPTADHQAQRTVDVLLEVYAATPTPHVLRPKSEIERFFAGLEIVPPHAGADPVVTFAGEWGAEDPKAADDDGSRWFYAALARKP